MARISSKDSHNATSVFTSYYNMITIGCGQSSSQCSNAYCKSSSNRRISQNTSSNEAAALSLILSYTAHTSSLCPIVKRYCESSFVQSEQADDDVGPETNDDDDDCDDDTSVGPETNEEELRLSSPRRKLSNAVLLDKSFTSGMKPKITTRTSYQPYKINHH